MLRFKIYLRNRLLKLGNFTKALTNIEAKNNDDKFDEYFPCCNLNA